MADRNVVTSNFKSLKLTKSLTFKTLLPLIISIILIISIFGFYLFTTTRANSKKFLIENILMPEFELLAKEKDVEFENIKKLTGYTAQKIEDKIQDSKERASDEVDQRFDMYMSKNPDGSYRSSLAESKGRYQMAAFFNNKIEPDTRHKGIFVDAFLFFDFFS